MCSLGICDYEVSSHLVTVRLRLAYDEPATPNVDIFDSLDGKTGGEIIREVIASERVCHILLTGNLGMLDILSARSF